MFNSEFDKVFNHIDDCFNDENCPINDDNQMIVKWVKRQEELKEKFSSIDENDY